LPSQDPRHARALGLIDEANRRDPNQDQGLPKELLYSQRMSDMLVRFNPAADPLMQLAVRAQHVERWTLPRSSFPMDKPGYHQWRTTLYGYHARRAGELLRQAGYDEEAIGRVMTAVSKQGIKHNADSQLVEDVAGLVFIEHYMAGFAADKPDYSEEKWIGIIRKTWRKMSDAAHAFALSGALRLPQGLVPLIQKAIAGPD
jgi:hypothetical protein